ncbi:hypothetical protein THAOC_04349, partial [Thalassiosira oceanica]
APSVAAAAAGKPPSENAAAGFMAEPSPTCMDLPVPGGPFSSLPPWQWFEFQQAVRRAKGIGRARGHPSQDPGVPPPLVGLALARALAQNPTKAERTQNATPR